MSLNLVNPFMKFASGGAPPAWTTAQDDAIQGMGSPDSSWGKTSNAQKYISGTWSAITAVPVARNLSWGGGNSTNGMMGGGSTGSGGSGGTSPQTNSYVWTGTWSANSATVTAHNMTWSGYKASDGIVAGGTYSAITDAEIWNGSAWASTTAMGTGTRGGNGGGFSTNALSGGGTGASSQDVETFDGSSWSAGTAFPSATLYGYSGGAGFKELFITVTNDSSAGACYTYDNTSWTATNNTTQTRKYAMMGGDSTGAIKLGHGTPVSTNSEVYDGTNWSSTGSGVSGVYSGGMGGNGS